MKMKNKILKISLLTVALIITLMSNTFVSASSLLGDVEPVPSDISKKMLDGGKQVAGIASAIGVAVAMVILIWLGIKYITASPDGKADVKKSALPYIIGAVVLFAASSILGLVATFASGLF